MRLKDKCAIITAAASGMGRAGVERFAREGARLAAVDINADALAALAAHMQAQGVKIETVQADLSDPAQARQAIDSAMHKLGGVDVLWAHAGSPGPGDVEQLDLPAYRTRAVAEPDIGDRDRRHGHSGDAFARRGFDHVHVLGLRAGRFDVQPDLLRGQVCRGRADEIPGPEIRQGRDPGERHLPRSGRYADEIGIHQPEWRSGGGAAERGAAHRHGADGAIVPGG